MIVDGFVKIMCVYVWKYVCVWRCVEVCVWMYVWEHVCGACVWRCTSTNALHVCVCVCVCMCVCVVAWRLAAPGRHEQGGESGGHGRHRRVRGGHLLHHVQQDQGGQVLHPGE